MNITGLHCIQQMRTFDRITCGLLGNTHAVVMSVDIVGLR